MFLKLMAGLCLVNRVMLLSVGLDRGIPDRSFSWHILCHSEGYPPTPLSCGSGGQQAAYRVYPYPDLGKTEVDRLLREGEGSRF